MSAPIDKGWAWCIVLACFIQHFLALGTVKAFGVFFMDLQRRFNTSAWFLSLINGLALFHMLGFGFVANALAIRFTSRKLVFVGGVTMSLGLVLSSVVSSVEWFLLTYGVILGIGLSLSSAPSIAAVAMYFRDRRASANSIAVCGAGVGQVVMTLLTRYLVDEYTTSGAMLILGGILLNIVAGAMLLRPLEFYRFRGVKVSDVSLLNYKDDDGFVTVRNNIIPFEMELEIQENDDEKDISVENYRLMSNRENDLDGDQKYIPMKVRNTELAITRQSENYDEESAGSVYLDKQNSETNKLCVVHDDIEISQDSKTKQHKVTKLSFCEKYFHPRLFLKRNFILCTISFFCFQFSFATIFTILPPFADDRGFSEKDGAILPSIAGGLDIVGRLAFGWIADKQLISRQCMFSISVLIVGLISLLLPLARGYVTICVMCGVYGLFGGGCASLLAVVCVDAAGVEYKFQAIGLAMFAQGLCVFPSSLSVGALRDMTGNWEASLHLTGAIAVVGGIVGGVEIIITACTRLMNRL